ncbi:MAG: formylglycine-generating enzyme family protein, partial [Tannerella sp.]|nr:formylglycine-generating enzyme family protein [Tannerella sp.]
MKGFTKCPNGHYFKEELPYCPYCQGGEVQREIDGREVVQREYSSSRIGIEMIAIAGGTFWMGAQNTDPNAPNYDEGAWDDESPVHQVTLSDYFIGKYPVTQAQWKAVMGNNPSYFKGDNLPVENVSWNDVQEFIRKLNQQTGKNYRLPTEAEWEFAARGGNQSRGYKYSGSNTAGNVAWYDDNSGDKTHPVGTKQANELGIYDMSGNVWERCADWYDSYSSAAQFNPTGPTSGSFHVFRGGSWYYNARLARVSYHNDYGDTDDRPYTRQGFRVACSPFELIFPKAPIISPIQQPPSKNTNSTDKFGIEMIAVEGGTFLMGAQNTDPNAPNYYADAQDNKWNSESPVHNVKLSDFFIGKYEVMQAQWNAVMGSNPSHFKGDNLPVESVSWDDVQEFIHKLNQQTGKKYRLPTEAEWEFAA